MRKAQTVSMGEGWGEGRHSTSKTVKKKIEVPPHPNLLPQQIAVIFLHSAGGRRDKSKIGLNLFNVFALYGGNIYPHLKIYAILPS